MSFNKQLIIKMVTFKRRIGDIGEDVACQYIIERGFRVLARNYDKRMGEIDIISKYKDGTLVFFEIKTIMGHVGDFNLHPEDNLTASKLNKLKRICSLFVGKHPNLIIEEKGWRIDLLAIILDNRTSGTESIINHYENI